MDREQLIFTADDHERELLLRELRVKDEILFLTDGFMDDAKSVQEELEPVDLHVQGDLPEETQAAVHRNMQRLGAFARRWGLPFTPMVGLDFGYLFEHPFSGAPMVVGKMLAVGVREGVGPPLLSLTIDVRFPKPWITQEVDDHIDRVRAELAPEGDERYSLLREREIRNLENLVKAKRLKDNGLKNAEIANELNLKDLRRIPRLREELTELVRRGYRSIAPYMNPEWDGRRIRAHFPPGDE